MMSCAAISCIVLHYAVLNLHFAEYVELRSTAFSPLTDGPQQSTAGTFGGFKSEGGSRPMDPVCQLRPWIYVAS